MNRTWAFLFSAMLGGFAAAQTPAPAPNVAAVTNSATFLPNSTVPLAPGMLFSIFGSNLANQIAQPSSLVLSSSLAGVTVQFENNNATFTAPLSYVQPGTGTTSLINAQVPWELAPTGSGTTTWNVVVNNNGATSTPTAVTVGSASPGVFTSNNLGIVINLDGTLAQPANAIPTLTTHPAKPGDTVIIYATGLGAVTPTISDGQNALNQLRNTLVTPVVLIGGQPAQVLFSGLTPQYPGVNQLNVVIPNVPTNNSTPIQIQIGGFTSPATVTFGVIN
jgi:uncharacterized protein (TIGR03437 family)